MNTNTRCPGATPMTGCTPMPMCPAMPPMGPYESCCRVVEPTTVCPYQQHHYHRVDHIKPVVIRNIHQHHIQHNYVTAPSQTTEAYYYDEYLASSQPVATPVAQQQMMSNQMTYQTQTTETTQSLGQGTVTPQGYNPFSLM